MSYLVKACTSPITDFTGPLYHLVKGDANKKDFEKLILATFRTATAVSIFFVYVSFSRIVGSDDNLSASLAMTSQWLIHPYSAAMSHAYISGGHILLMKSINLIFKRQFSLPRDEMGLLTFSIAFCYIGQLLKDYVLEHCYLDKKFQDWSKRLAGTASSTAGLTIDAPHILEEASDTDL